VAAAAAAAIRAVTLIRGFLMIASLL